ncbi:hypothetical protein [Hymenobacter wooponensis]|uniref:Uncharacterized protein n=1 Tax=Hymenobacter wooponensis TaxID=1525360 RepID=A0A4Z0MHI7_9BACT|nr:hypothetical protein [Hymenobacter wooponensis]TGD78976.1 hypothetical protein EU557_18565 [Hymenobacter wooponensis]
MKILHLLLAAGLFLSASPAWAQDEGRGKGKDKDKKEYKEKDRKDYDKERKDYYKDRKDEDKERDDRYKDGRADSRNPRTVGGVGGVLGRVILPRPGTPGPRELAGVPKGHYPPPGECRIWYPNRPPGHQPPPTSCDRLVGVRLEPGAFILHGDRAYDAEYDWRAAEQRRPGTVGRDILDILFPRR